MFRKTKIALALALIMTLSLSLLAPISVVAAPTKTATQAAITKLLKVPVGTKAPIYSFKFLVEPLNINGDDDPDIVKDIPKANTAVNNEVTISFTGTEVSKKCECDMNVQGVQQTACPDDVGHYYKESASLFSASSGWKYAGIYEYRITEVKTAFTNNDDQHMTFSNAEYTLRVYVSGSSASGFTIDRITATKALNDAGTQTGDGAGSKVNPNPGTNPGGLEPGTSVSQMRFTNEYYKQNGGNGKDPGTKAKQTLSVTKLVAGDFSSKDMYFNFTLTVKKNSLVKEDVTYRVYILAAGATDGNNLSPLDSSEFSKNAVAVIGSSAVAKAEGGFAYMEISPTSDTDVTLTFKLKHNQRLVITNAHVGTGYTIKEAAVKGYKAKVTVKTANESVDVTKENIDPDLELLVPTASIPPTPPTFLRIGDHDGSKVNEAKFTNTTTTATDTGLNVTDLPFYGMIILALAGLVTFVIVKIRSSKNKEDYHV